MSKTEAAVFTDGKELHKLKDIKVPTAVDPRRIRADSTKNVSRWGAPRQRDLEVLALSMSKYGNTNPVPVMRLVGDQLYDLDLVAGFHRHRSALMIIEGFDMDDPSHEDASVPAPKLRVHIPEFRLRVQVTELNDSDRVRANIVENSMRTDVTAMDQASIVRYCEDVLSLEAKEIAEWLKVTPGYVRQIKKLLMLPRMIQDGLASGLFTTSKRVLMKLIDLPPEDRQAFYDTILLGNILTLEDVQSFIVDKNGAVGSDDEDEDKDGVAAEADDKPDRNGMPRMQVTPRLLRKWFEQTSGRTVLPAVARYSATMLKFLKGDGGSPDKHEVALYKVHDGGARVLFDYLVEESLIPADTPLKVLWEKAQESALAKVPAPKKSEELPAPAKSTKSTKAALKKAAPKKAASKK